jgi:hypothetical protein
MASRWRVEKALAPAVAHRFIVNLAGPHKRCG